MDDISALSNYQSMQSMANYVHPVPPPGPHPAPAPAPDPTPAPGPTPSPSPTPSGFPVPNGDNFAKFVHTLTPTERADAVPSAMQLENIEMANNYQQAYEDAMNADGNGDSTDSTSSSSSSSGLSSPDFYVDMYKDAKAMNIDTWIQEHLYELENLDRMNSQFNFNTFAVVNAGTANGMNIPSDFMSNPAYRSASGVNPTGGATDPAGAYQGLQNYLSPDDVANRSVDMMVSMYNGAAQSGGDSVDARQGYADSMRGMLERSYDQSRNQLLTGGGTADARSALTQTTTLINQGLDNFVENGPDPTKSQPGGLYDQLRSYASSTRTSYAPSSPNGAPVTPENLALGGVPMGLYIQA